jgi:hypothetical protein
MEKTNINAVLAIFLAATAVAIIGGLVVLPATQEAQAANPTSESRNKGQQGDISSDCKRQGKDIKLTECNQPPPPPPPVGPFCFSFGFDSGEGGGGGGRECFPTLPECEERRAPLLADPRYTVSECEPQGG